MAYIDPNMKFFERKVHSQFGEDGVIERLAACLGLARPSFFEFGIGPVDNVSLDKGMEGNFVHLEKQGGVGVFLNGRSWDGFGVRAEFITPLNINRLYAKHAVAPDLDFMSIDVDGQDFWIWMALYHRPKVMVIEYNGGLGPDVSQTVVFDCGFIWDGTIYQGASLRAHNKLAIDKGYTLVWSNGVNGIFVRDDLVSNKVDFVFESIFVAYPPHLPDPLSRAWVQV